MTKDPNNLPMPDALKWIIGIFVAIVLIWCFTAGIGRTLALFGWITGLTLASLVLFAILIHIGEKPMKEGFVSKAYVAVSVIGGTIALGMALLAGWLLVVAVLGAAKVVVSPFIGHSHEDHPEDGPLDYRY